MSDSSALVAVCLAESLSLCRASISSLEAAVAMRSVICPPATPVVSCFFRLSISLLYCFSSALSSSTSFTLALFLTCLAWLANRRVLCVSSPCWLDGVMVEMMDVRQLPPRLGWGVQ